MNTEPTYSVRGGDEARLAELILYVSAKCQSAERFGATKLNKILWWADFLAYAEFGEPITGVEYMRLDNGPVPRRLLPVRERMIADQELAISSVRCPGGHTEKRPVPLREADLNRFSSEEIALVDWVIDQLWSKTAARVSTLSHGKAWEVAADRENIPYEAIFLSDDSPDRADTVRTKELAREHGWEVA